MLVTEAALNQILRYKTDQTIPGNSPGADLGSDLFVPLKDNNLATTLCQQFSTGKSARTGANNKNVCMEGTVQGSGVKVEVYGYGFCCTSGVSPRKIPQNIIYAIRGEAPLLHFSLIFNVRLEKEPHGFREYFFECSFTAVDGTDHILG